MYKRVLALIFIVFLLFNINGQNIKVKATQTFDSTITQYEGKIRRTIYDAISKKRDSISLSSLIARISSSKDNISVESYINNIFFEVAGQNNINANGYYLNDSKCIYVIYYDNYNASELENFIEDFIDKYIDDDDSELEKEIKTVSYIINNCEYDQEVADSVKEDEKLDSSSSNAFNAYGTLIEKKAVCKGYAQAINLILNRMGIPSVSINSKDLNHEWNVVKIDGKLYQLDSTWIMQKLDTTNCEFNNFDSSFFNFTVDEENHKATDIDKEDLYNQCINKDYENYFNKNNYQLSFGYNLESERVLCYNNHNFYINNLDGSNIFTTSASSNAEDNIVEGFFFNDKYYYICRPYDVCYFMELNMNTGEVNNIATLNSNITIYGASYMNQERIISDCNFGFESNNTILVNYIDGSIQKINVQPFEKTTNSHLVKFVDYDKMVISQQRVKDGQNAISPNKPYRVGYKFIGWKDSVNNISSELTTYAKYEKNNDDLSDKKINYLAIGYSAAKYFLLIMCVCALIILTKVRKRY